MNRENDSVSEKRISAIIKKSYRSNAVSFLSLPPLLLFLFVWSPLLFLCAQLHTPYAKRQGRKSSVLHGCTNPHNACTALHYTYFRACLSCCLLCSPSSSFHNFTLGRLTEIISCQIKKPEQWICMRYRYYRTDLD